MATVKEAAARLNTSINNVSLQLRSGKLKGHKAPSGKRMVWVVEESQLPAQQAPQHKERGGGKSKENQQKEFTHTNLTEVVINWLKRYSEPDKVSVAELSAMVEDLSAGLRQAKI